MLRLITNQDPMENEFFLRDGAVYFSGLYENSLLNAGITGANPLRPAFSAEFACVEQTRHRFGC